MEMNDQQQEILNLAFAMSDKGRGHTCRVLITAALMVAAGGGLQAGLSRKEMHQRLEDVFGEKYDLAAQMAGTAGSA